MIRRGFWMAVGAMGGIMAYRRVASVAKRGWARETIRFTRDVRDGMDLYAVRHPGEAGPTLGTTEDRAEPPKTAGTTKDRGTTEDENEKDDR